MSRRDDAFPTLRRRFPLGPVTAALLVLLVLSVVVSITFGPVHIESGEVTRILSCKFASLFSYSAVSYTHLTLPTT